MNVSALKHTGREDLKGTVKPPGSLPRIPALTGLRFFAAFFILFAHSVDWLAQFQNSNVRQNFSFVAMYGMPLFFVLSGFVIHYNYRRVFMSCGAGRAICEFAAARFARLFPLYFFLLVIAVAADDFIGKVHNQEDLWAAILAYYVTLTQTWWYIIYGERSIIYWIFSVSWSISTEVFFYVAFVPVVSLILAIRTARQSLVVGVGYALVVTATLVVVRYNLAAVLTFAETRVPDYIGPDRFEQSFYRWLFYFSPYVRVFEFFMGCLAAQAFMLHLERPVMWREQFLANIGLGGAFLALICFGVIYLGAIDLGEINAYVRHLSLNFLCAPLIGFILFYSARYDTSVSRFISLPGIVLMGEASYSIYLIHPWTLRIFSQPPAPDANWLWGSAAVLRVGCAIVLTLLMSFATYRLVEVPSRHWLRRKLARIIAIVFGEVDARTSLTSSVASLRARIAVAGCAFAVFALIFFLGQAARSDRVAEALHRLWVGSRPEITVVRASFGLNCRDFPVPPPHQRAVSVGNASASVRRACDRRQSCDYTVDIFKIGDPANSCGKEFLVEYQCTSTSVLRRAFLPAEAHGKTVTLTCGGEDSG
jgi:peptidoglycan/LPS O-acetylase OafA/YrhL